MKIRRLLLPCAALLAAACDGSPTGDPGGKGGGPRFDSPVTLPVLGLGEVAERHTSELTVRGSWAYTGTHGNRGGNLGNVIKVWDVSGSTPVLVNTVAVPGVPTEPEPEGEPGPDAHPGHGEGEEHEHSAILNRVGDLQVSDDGSLLVAATEGGEGSIVVFSLADPANPTFLSRFANANTLPGVHTAEVARVDGRLYGFLSINPGGGLLAKLLIVDLGDPEHPAEVWSGAMGRPFQHDVFVRDGLLFTAVWDDGVGIWDIGGGGRGGSVSNPVKISQIETVNGNAHNLHWLHDPRTGEKRWLLVGEESPGAGGRYQGDIHVLDVSDLANPREVAFYHLEHAGTHNFSVDEENGILYAAFYNGGVRALDVRGDLGSCEASDKDGLGRCDLGKMKRVAGLALENAGRTVNVWGVELEGGHLYASDMPNGLWKLDAAPLRGLD